MQKPINIHNSSVLTQLKFYNFIWQESEYHDLGYKINKFYPIDTLHKFLIKFSMRIN